MKVNRRYLILLVTGAALIITSAGKAQQLNKEVFVVSSYRPEIADAEKIGGMPDITDTVSMETSIDYTLLPSRIKTDFAPKTIKPATMVGTPLDKLYNSYLKLGLGNYTTPLAEYSIHNLRSKDYAIGAYFFHKSSHTKLTLDNTAEVPAGYARNELSLYGKRFYKGLNVTGDFGYSSHRVRHYGYNTSNFPDSVPEPKASDIRQSFMLFYGEAGLHATEGDSGAVDYSLNLRGEYFRDHFKNKEPHVALRGNLSFPIGSFRAGLGVDLDYFSLDNGDSLYTESITTLKPFVMKRTKEWEVKIAARASVENTEETQVRVYPDLSIRFQVINKALITYFGLSGYLQNNSYQHMAGLNPFLIPGLYTENTNHRLIAVGGLEGHLSSNSAYRIDITFDAMENVPFFLNDTNSLMQNTFGIVYDDADLIRYHGELGWKPLTYLSFMTDFNYSAYKMVAENKPWHRPAFDFTFTTRYNFKEKIYVQIDYLYYGKRFAKNLYPGSPEITLAPINDLNLKLEYRYSDVLSGFLDFYNLLSQEYYLWNQYPSQRLNVLAGVTYKF